VTRRPGPATLAAATLGALALLVLLGPALHGVDPAAQPDPVGLALRAPSAAAWLGTDALSRDLLARVLAGGRVSLAIAATASLLAFGLGTAWGLMAGWRGGWLDALLMRTVDALLALPRVLVLLVLLGFWDARTPLLLGVTLGLTGWMGTSRLVRADVRAAREAPWVLAARALGLREGRILRLHLLPVALRQGRVAAALAAAQALMLDAGLAAIGLGLAPPQASWGTLLAAAISEAQFHWWLLAAPGIPLLVASAAALALADALGDASGTAVAERP
jgi:ABC-type dipeptide/oligopeptide/nickel transport system permease subunit